MLLKKVGHYFIEDIKLGHYSTHKLLYLTYFFYYIKVIRQYENKILMVVGFTTTYAISAYHH
jgi:hypothetical protein